MILFGAENCSACNLQYAHCVCVCVCGFVLFCFFNCYLWLWFYSHLTVASTDIVFKDTLLFIISLSFSGPSASMVGHSLTDKFL